MRDERRRRIHAQRHHLTLDRQDRRPQRGGKAFDAARPCARREHHDLGADVAAVGELDPDRAILLDENTLHSPGRAGFAML